ncbi:hypothetical protein [Kibdelosporangium philippinense]|uniref:hypothetical protein n=1 Tax=Kibdelosporangium philippinense TaxID=211113 RepID=UPI00361A9414
MTLAIRFAFLAGIMAAGSVLVAPVAPAASAQQPAVQWSTCPDGALDDVPDEEKPLFSCATYAVPLDHDRPRGKPSRSR